MDIIIITFIIMGLILFAVQGTYLKNQKESAEGKYELGKFLNKQLKKVSNKMTFYEAYSKNYLGIAIDDDNKEFYLVKYIKGVLHKCHGKYEDILSIEFISDGNVVDKVVKENALGRAALGGLIFGGVGAIVGATTANSVNVGRRTIQINLVLNNPNHPNYQMDFLDTTYTKSTYGMVDIVYQKAIKEAREWNALLTYIIKHSEKVNKEKTITSSAKQTNNSISDELQKLADLKEKGIITDNEFAQCKSKLLSNNLDASWNSQMEKVDNNRCIAKYKLGENKVYDFINNLSIESKFD